MSLGVRCPSCRAIYPTNDEMEDHRRVCGVALRKERVLVVDMLAKAERDADDAVKALARLAEITWNAGCPGGDREQTARNIRTIVAERDALRIRVAELEAKLAEREAAL